MVKKFNAPIRPDITWGNCKKSCFRDFDECRDDCYEFRPNPICINECKNDYRYHQYLQDFP